MSRIFIIHHSAFILYVAAHPCHTRTLLAQQLVRSLDANIPPVVHIVRFPKLSINHALVLFAHQCTASEVRFMAYDPNLPEAPVPLIYNRAERRFNYPPNHYFAGGNGDFSVIVDNKSEFVYFLISSYNKDVSEQGVSVARMRYAGTGTLRWAGY